MWAVAVPVGKARSDYRNETHGLAVHRKRMLHDGTRFSSIYLRLISTIGTIRCTCADAHELYALNRSLRSPDLFSASQHHFTSTETRPCHPLPHMRMFTVPADAPPTEHM